MSVTEITAPAGAAFAAVLTALHADAFAPPARWGAEAFAGLLASPGVFALLWHDGDHPAGFVLARAVADEAEILTLAVAPDRRRQGIARSLVERLGQKLTALSVTRLFLEVSARNLPAQALYEAAGFSRAGLRRRYYEDDSDAVVMVLDTGPVSTRTPEPERAT